MLRLRAGPARSRPCSTPTRATSSRSPSSGTRVYAATSPDGRVYVIEGDRAGARRSSIRRRSTSGRSRSTTSGRALGRRRQSRGRSIASSRTAPSQVVYARRRRTSSRSRATPRAACSPAPSRRDGCIASTPTIVPFVLLDSGLTELRAAAVDRTTASSSPRRCRAATTRRRRAARPTSVAVTLPAPRSPAGQARLEHQLEPAAGAPFGAVSHRSERHVGVGLGDRATSSTTSPLPTTAACSSRRARKAGSTGRARRATCCCSPASTPSRSRDSRRAPQAGARVAAFATANPGRVVASAPAMQPTSTYVSSVRDSKSVATWGLIRWEGAGSVTLATRSGNTEKPDDSWSDWSAAVHAARGRSDHESGGALPSVARGPDARHGRGTRRRSPSVTVAYLAAQHAAGRDVGDRPSAGRRLSAAVLQRRRRDRRARRRRRRRAAPAGRSRPAAAVARPPHVPERACRRLPGRPRTPTAIACRTRCSTAAKARPPGATLRAGLTDAIFVWDTTRRRRRPLRRPRPRVRQPVERRRPRARSASATAIRSTSTTRRR